MISEKSRVCERCYKGLSLCLIGGWVGGGGLFASFNLNYCSQRFEITLTGKYSLRAELSGQLGAGHHVSSG